MQLPVMRGLIERRILANYRVDPAILARLLPAPFRPKLVGGQGIAGLCLIRLGEVRPAFAPGWLGVASENAAHRVAVEWDEAGVRREGVFVLRRDTNSWLNTVAGGRLFPGVHSHAAFTVEETDDRYHVAFRSDADGTSAVVRGRRTSAWPEGSAFSSLADASAFFEAGSLGYSEDGGSRLEGLELRCREWRAEALALDEVRSSFFDDRAIFPPGSIELDCALLMRGIEHEWHARGELVGHEAQLTR